MAIRQYIGARYVLKIYENSLDPNSAEWESGTAYEPLTMVNYNNSSYISRKEVPPTIGNPVDNPTYWALSGLYNGQIASLQTQINAIGDEVDDLQAELPTKVTKFSSRRLLCLGDSYDEYGGGWIDKIATILDCDVVRVSRGSYGIIGYSDGQSYINLLRDATISDPETVTDVVICGGGNDRNHSYSDLLTAATELKTYILGRFPNVENFYMGWLYYNFTSATNQATVGNGRRMYIQLCEDLHFHWLANCEYIMLDFTNVRTGIGNYNHPTDDAVALMAKFIAAALEGHPLSYTADRAITGSWISPFDDYNTPGNPKSMFVRFDNNQVILYMGYSTISNSAGTLAGNTTFQMLDLGDFRLPFKQTTTRFTLFLLPYNSTLSMRISLPVILQIDGTDLNKLSIRTVSTIAGNDYQLMGNQYESMIYY